MITTKQIASVIRSYKQISIKKSTARLEANLLYNWSKSVGPFVLQHLVAAAPLASRG